MPYSSGTFSLFTPGNPVVTGTTIASTWANNTLNDIATALSTCVLKDGTQTITANLPMSNFKLTGLGAGTTNGDSIRWQQSAAGVMTTQGDILFASGANTPARLAIGASDLPLVVNAGATAPQWGFANKTANTVLSGPTSGGAAAPAFRALVNSDVAGLPSVSSGEVATTSGTTVDLTGIPAWAKQVIVQFNGVSTNGTNELLLQIGSSSGGVETSGYVSSAGNSTGNAASSSAFILTQGVTAPTTHDGSILLTLEKLSSNTWVTQGVLSRSDGRIQNNAGRKSLTSTLDRVRITTVGGIDTFDAGAINVVYS